MTNKDALEALDTLSSIAHLNLHGSVETTQFDCIDTIRQALEVNQELVEALNNTKALFSSIWEGAQRVDINHEDFRIKVGTWVRDWLEEQEWQRKQKLF